MEIKWNSYSKNKSLLKSGDVLKAKNAPRNISQQNLLIRTRTVNFDPKTMRSNNLKYKYLSNI